MLIFLHLKLIDFLSKFTTKNKQLNDLHHKWETTARGPDAAHEKTLYGPHAGIKFWFTEKNFYLRLRFEKMFEIRHCISINKKKTQVRCHMH